MTRTFKVLCLVLLVVGVAIFFIDRSRFLGALPFLFLLACPLMHLFMHSGHDHHSGSKEDETGAKQKEHNMTH
jgi:multisubunit Na+/H+ antiporter MnhG subunit